MLSKFLRSKVAAGAGDLAWDRVFGVFRARGAARYGCLGLSDATSDIPTLASTRSPDGDNPTSARSSGYPGSAPMRTSGVTSTRSSGRARLDVMLRLPARQSTVRYLCVEQAANPCVEQACSEEQAANQACSEEQAANLCVEHAWSQEQAEEQACSEERAAKDGPMTLELLARIVQGGLKKLENKMEQLENKMEQRLGALEDKLGHAVEFQVRSQVAKQYGSGYAEQRVDDCIINLVAHVPSTLLPTDPMSPDKFSQVTHTARLISKKLIADGVPEDFLNKLVDYLKIPRTEVMKTQEDGSTKFNFDPICSHKLVKGQWLALAQLREFFELKNNEVKADSLKSCKGPGVLLMVFKASPQAIFKKDSVALYNTLEFDFQGEMNMFVAGKLISGTIEVGEGKARWILGGPWISWRCDSTFSSSSWR